MLELSTDPFLLQTILGKLYQEEYFRDDLLKAASHLRQAAEAQGLSPHSVALRWVFHHSVLKREYRDAVIIGASSIAQTEQNLDIVEKGPLPESLVKEVEAVWQIAKDAAPAYHK